MEINRSTLHGLWLPLITPFRDGVLDEVSLRRLVTHYAAQPVDGFILGATTGEGMALDDDEAERLVAITRAALAEAGRAMPIYLGLSGSDTRKLVKTMAQTTEWGMDGYLIACPCWALAPERRRPERIDLGVGRQPGRKHERTCNGNRQEHDLHLV